MPSSGARSGTSKGRPPLAGAGDGAVMARRSLRCGHSIPREQEPVATQGGKRWYSCPECNTIQRGR